jgi:hypothetical protein
MPDANKEAGGEAFLIRVVGGNRYKIKGFTPPYF